VLLGFSILVVGSPTLEGVFGLVAACGVLCYAAPGSLGTAYAARCTRVCALICAGMAFFQALTLSTVALAIPHVPRKIMETCGEAAIEEPFEPFVASQSDFELVIDPPTAAEHGAKAVAIVVTTAARRMQDISGRTIDCEMVAGFSQGVPPSLVQFFAFLELGLFVSAVATAKAAARLMSDARRFGANAL